MEDAMPFQFPAPVSVLDCTLDWPRYTNRYREMFGDADINKVINGEYPDDPAFVVIPGSTYSIFEADWADELVERTREYIEDGVPVLGICFGHQVIAAALGGTVVRMDDYEMGYRPVQLDGSPLFDGLNEVEYPFSTHQDKVTNLPAEMRTVAETDRCIQGIEHVEKPVFGVQFHLDLTRPIKKKAIQTKELDGDRKKQLMDELTAENVDRAKRTLKIVDNFRKIATGELPRQHEAEDGT